MQIMMPNMGDMVIYRLTAADADAINRRRTDGISIARRIARNDPTGMSSAWPIGAQAHIGTPVVEGEEFPMMVVKPYTRGIRGQVFLDGTDVLWVVDISMGSEPGMWHWPFRASVDQSAYYCPTELPSPRIPVRRPNCF